MFGLGSPIPDEAALRYVDGVAEPERGNHPLG